MFWRAILVVLLEIFVLVYLVVFAGTKHLESFGEIFKMQLFPLISDQINMKIEGKQNQKQNEVVIKEKQSRRKNNDPKEIIIETNCKKETVQKRSTKKISGKQNLMWFVIKILLILAKRIDKSKKYFNRTKISQTLRVYLIQNWFIST